MWGGTVQFGGKTPGLAELVPANKRTNAPSAHPLRMEFITPSSPSLRLRTARRAALSRPAGAERGQPQGQIVDVHRAVAVVVGAVVRRVARCSKVREPHRQVVDADAVHTIEIERGND